MTMGMAHGPYFKGVTTLELRQLDIRGISALNIERELPNNLALSSQWPWFKTSAPNDLVSVI